MQGGFIDAKFCDTVCVQCTSSSVAASQKGIIDGLTEHRTHVLIKGEYCYFMITISNQVEVTPSITEEDKDKDIC